MNLMNCLNRKKENNKNGNDYTKATYDKNG